MVDLLSLGIDTSARDEGRWFPWIKGAELRIASFRSKRFKVRLEELKEPHAALLSVAPGSTEAMRVEEELSRRAMADCILMDWRGIEGPDGEPIPYTPERGFAVLMDERYEHIVTFISNKASGTSDFLGAGGKIPGELPAALAKNSKPPATGSPPTPAGKAS